MMKPEFKTNLSMLGRKSLEENNTSFILEQITNNRID